MSRLISRLTPLAFLLPLLARAAEATKDVPAEEANPAVVIGFLALLLGSCVAYVAWMYMSKKKGKAD